MREGSRAINVNKIIHTIIVSEKRKSRITRYEKETVGKAGKRMENIFEDKTMFLLRLAAISGF